MDGRSRDTRHAVPDAMATGLAWRRCGARVAVATVTATRRSAPRPVGTKMVVADDGRLAGSVSGGCVEAEVVHVAGEVLADGRPRHRTYGISDDEAFGVGLPCGGEIDVLVEVLDTDPAVCGLVDGARSGAVVTVLDGPTAGRRLVLDLDDDAVTGDGGDDLLALVPAVRATGRSATVEHDGARVLVDLWGPTARLVVVGAYDIAEELCAGAGRLGWRTVVVDPRAQLLTPERLPSADQLVARWPAEGLALLAPDAATAVVVLTHEQRFDVPALVAALATPAFYVGAMGSRRTQRRRTPLLLEAGLTEAQLGRIHGPCGLDVGGASPAETALSILAEILAVRAGRDGGPLRRGSASIHPGTDPLVPV